jgi:shikimate dehydrogenase
VTEPLTITGATPVFALLGAPVAHSRSPRLHNGLFAHTGTAGVYVALPVDPTSSGAALVQTVRTLGLAGANLTVPFKERVLPHLDALAPSAARAGSVNTLVRDGSRLIGHNTDGHGIVKSARAASWAPGGRALVLGAGGAGRAVAAALVAAGCEVAVLNRSPARAQAVGQALGLRTGPLSPAGMAELGAGAELVVNCCTPAADDAVAALPPAALAPGALWVDTNYFRAPLPVPERDGLRQLDGRGMLLHQGLAAFTLWTGCPVTAAQARAWGVAP